MGKLFERYGLNAPGKVNLLLDGRFQTVRLDDLEDDKLQQLYEKGCRYVKPTDAGIKKLYPNEKEIKVSPVKLNPSSEKRKNK
jgi:hypothetical protein